VLYKDDRYLQVKIMKHYFHSI